MNINYFRLHYYAKYIALFVRACPRTSPTLQLIAERVHTTMLAVSLLLSCVAVFVSLSAGQNVDRTINPEGSGANIVEAVIAKIRQAGIFAEDNSLLRRIAYVESRDGTDPKTYRTGYFGGMWQVNGIDFQKTKDTATYPALVSKYEQIEQNFNINWPNVPWYDLRIPLYSGLAAYLLLSTIQQPIPFASEIDLQANYWKLYYNNAGTVQLFIENVRALEAAKGMLYQYEQK